MENAIDKRKQFGALLMDLSRAFDCPAHEQFIAKVHVSILESPTLKLL